MNKSAFLAVLFYAFSVSTAFAASTDADAVSARSKDEIDYYKFNKELQDKDLFKVETDVVEQLTELPEDLPSDTKIKVFVKKIKNNETNILDQKKLERLYSVYENKEVSFKELNTLLDAIYGLYIMSDYSNARAILPPQKIKDGVVEVLLVEGRVGKIDVNGNKHSKKAYVQKRLKISEGDLVSLDELENKVFLFNRLNDVKVRASLKPGETFGTTDYTLNVQEPKKHEAVAFLDNAGSDDVGKERFGFVANTRGLLAPWDKLSLGGVFAFGTTNLFSSYTINLNSYGTKLGVSYDYSKTKIRTGLLKSLKIEGNSTDMGIFLKQPLLNGRRFALDSFLGFNSKRTTSAYDDFGVSAVKIRKLSWGLNYQYYMNGAAVEFNNNFNKAYDRFRGDRRFFTYNNDLKLVFALPKNSHLMLRGRSQFSDIRNLPSSEKFQLGGISSVRGYTSGILGGDSGYLASAELSIPIVENKLNGILFYDTGSTFNSKASFGMPANDDTLSSTGLGFNVALRKNVSGRVIFAVPLEEYAEDDNDTVIVHFDIQYTF